MYLNDFLSISPQVKEAIHNGKPVVALESTIISHGMPYPKNVDTALKVEAIVKENGGIPATIAIINGKLKVGISKEEIDYLGKKGLEVIKASRRDIPILLARNEDGATTVAATMIIANMANIKIFATGGIGGVHRNGENTMDISADLEELSNTNVAVVCAGVKSILDLGLTLEYLETKGVPLIGYKTDELPAFYTRESGYKVNYTLETPFEIAKVLKIKNDLKMKGSLVIANPIPHQYAMDKDIIDKAINESILEAERIGIKGKDITPYLLDKVQNITKGKSLDANIELVYNNAKLGAEIAVQLSKL